MLYFELFYFSEEKLLPLSSYRQKGPRKAVRQLNTSEFTSLVQAHEKLVYTVCYQLTRDPFAAQDLCQETFLTAWHSIDRCDPASYRPYLARIASNKALDYLKRASTRHEEPVEILPETGVPGPEDELLSQDGEHALRSRILALPEPYRQVAEMNLLEELPPGEIAKQLGRSEKTVYTQLSRAKEQLRRGILKGGSP